MSAVNSNWPSLKACDIDLKEQRDLTHLTFRVHNVGKGVCVVGVGERGPNLPTHGFP